MKAKSGVTVFYTGFYAEKKLQEKFIPLSKTTLGAYNYPPRVKSPWQLPFKNITV